MSKLTPPSDPIEVFGEAYELLLEKVLELLHIDETNENKIKKVVEKAGASISQVQQLDESVRQKLHEAVHQKIQEDKTK